MEDFSDHPDEEGEEEDHPNELLFLNCLNLILYLAQAFVTVGIGQFGLFGFRTIQDISDRYPTLVTTAPWVSFTVSFLLIVAQLIWAVAQVFPDYRLKSNDGVKHYYVGVALCQFVWVIMFSYELPFISLFAALAQSAFLGFILHDQSKLLLLLENMLDYWILKFPWVLNVGWVIYVVAWNLAVVLVDFHASTTAQYWVNLVALVALGMAAFGTVFCAQAEYAIPAVIAFATIGISVELSNPDGQLVLWFGYDAIDAVRITSLLIGCIAMTATAIGTVIQMIVSSRRNVQAITDHHHQQDVELASDDET